MKLPPGPQAHVGARPAWQPWLARLLTLPFRRHHHREIAAVLSGLEATEPRITELYTEAVKQLGSDQAPVRLGGLCALEGLARDNPAHRQTTVNVICAYLRMPFSPAVPASRPEPDAAEDQKEPGPEKVTGIDGIGDPWHQERQVRLAAQRIIGEHLRDDGAKDQQSADPPSSHFWNNIRLDFTGATLIDLNLVNGVMADANFRGAIFAGDASFGGATFSGDARFGGATFTGDASFGGATFTGDASFGGATFTGDARFGGATFTADANFQEAVFSRDALFSEATFSGANFRQVAFGGVAGFRRVTFGGDIGFRRVAFTGVAGFGKAAFHGDAWFDKAAFSGGASFGEATFSRDAWFHKTTITRLAWFGKATFSGDAQFGEATFSGDARFDKTTFSRSARFGEVAFSGDTWFGEATFSGDAQFGEAIFSGDAWFGEAIFSGDAWFADATFSGDGDALHFGQARILSPGASHVWPTGWRLAEADGGGHTIVRASADGGS